MCGFCGVLSSQQAELLEATVKEMTLSLAHRGPDGQGVFVDKGIALGHRRLSVLDLSPTGSQPMTLRNGQVAIVFNGEIYNFLELRKELLREGRTFIGHSDTEVILNVYDAWGLEGLKRLEGIFAFGLWDSLRRRLVLMRDRLGVKPLFYASDRERLVFGSEIKALFAAGAVNGTIDEQALMEYLWFGNSYEERTIYRAVRALPPGYWMIAEDSRIRLEPWWKVEQWIEHSSLFSREEDASHALRRAVDAAVARQLVADVPVGIFLSGGLDSSAIAASAMNPQSRPLKSFTVGFDSEQGVDELQRARLVADHLGLEHHEVRVGDQDLAETIVKLVRAHDEPFADAANVPLYLLAKELGGSMKVVLQGDGGDEMFGGYRRYAILRHSALWRCWPRWLTEMAHATFGRIGQRIARLADAAAAPEPALRMALLLTTETLRNAPTSFLTPEARGHLEACTNPFLAYERCAERFQLDDPVQQMLLTDITLQLPSQFLAKVDRSTMAQGLEARVPLLDETVAELAIGLPSSWKVRGAKKKIVLREAMRQRLPAEILNGPKRGFGVPYGHWLRTSLYEIARDEMLAPDFIASFGFERKAIENGLMEHHEGRRQLGFSLWKIFQLALWQKAKNNSDAAKDFH
jgi:asparagine synthase (glutamine-hydrolysing)